VVCVVQITGNKDVGKTALAERIISLARSLGYRVVAVKQSHHVPDVPDKDSYRMRTAGADVVALRGGGVWAVYSDRLPLSRIDADLVVIEGFRDAKLGFKIHIGPNPPADADVVASLEDALRGPEEFLRRAKCGVDAGELLAFLATR